MGAKQNDLLKRGAVALRELRDENGELGEKVAQLSDEVDRIKIATALVFRLYDEGSIAAEELGEAIEDFMEKSTDEIEVIEKAAEFSRRGGSALKFGKLSDHFQDDGLSPEGRFYASLQED